MKGLDRRTVLKGVVILLFALFTHNLYCEKIIDLKVPDSFKRITYEEGSFSSWVQHLELKKDNSVLDYKGDDRSRYYSVYRVVNRQLLFRDDLEQCADFCVRFWYDYNRETRSLKNLYLFEYSGKRKVYKQGEDPKSFLRKSMAYSNSYSIKAGAAKITEENIQPGDMIVQNVDGGIGHVSMIMDVCTNNRGEKLFLIGFSYMPAQEFHIERASDNYGIDPWFSLRGYYKYLKEKMDYGEPVLRRF